MGSFARKFRVKARAVEKSLKDENNRIQSEIYKAEAIKRQEEWFKKEEQRKVEIGARVKCMMTRTLHQGSNSRPSGRSTLITLLSIAALLSVPSFACSSEPEDE